MKVVYEASFLSYGVICLLCLPLLAIWTSPKAKLSTVDCLEADRLEFYYRIAAQLGPEKCLHHGSFSPLIFTTAGGMGPTASVVFQRLASLLSAKRNEHYSKTILFIRCQIGFALLRSAIRCLRGSRSTFTPDLANTCMDLALTEGRVAY